MERRTFLKGLVGTAMTAGALYAEDKMGGPINKLVEKGEESYHLFMAKRRLEQLKNYSTELAAWNLPPTVTPEDADYQRVDAFIERVNAFQASLQIRIGAPLGTEQASLPLTQQHEARALLLASTLPRELTQIASSLVKLGGTEEALGRVVAKHLINSFATCNSQGLVYEALKRAIQEKGGRITFHRAPTYYASRVRDFLPMSVELTYQDIDPRNQEQASTRDREEINMHRGWSEETRARAFAQLALHPGIRAFAKREDLTLVEYISWLKAIHSEREVMAQRAAPQRVTESLEITAVRLLNMHRALMRTNILDAATQKVILLYGNDNDILHGIEETGWERIAQGVGVPRERIAKMATTQATSGEQLEERFLQTVRASREKTFIAIETHGSSLGITTDSREGRVSRITVSRFAEILLERVIASRDTDTLEQVTILFGSCYSYNFTRNLLQEMQSAWETMGQDLNPPVPFSRIKLPAIIAGSQKDSSTLNSATVEHLLLPHLEGLRADHALTGERLLRNVQPSAYAKQCDLTFFAQGSGAEYAADERTSSAATV